MLARDFEIVQDGSRQPYLDVATAPEAGKDRDDPALAEWIVAVRWIETRDRADAVRDSDFFVNQNSAVKLTHGYTREKLIEAFEIAEPCHLSPQDS